MLNKEQMIKKIEKGVYCIVKVADCSERGYHYELGKGIGKNMSFVELTDERAMEWLELGAEMIYL